MIGGLFDTFQLVMLVLFLGTFVGRTVMLLTRGINPVKIANKAWGLRQIVEMVFPIWLVLLTVEVLRASLNLPFRLLPPLFDTLLLNWLPAQIVGVLLC